MKSCVLLIALLISGCLPPIPQPSPPIPKPPVPVSGTLWLIVVRETATQSPAVAALLADSWWAAQASQDVRFRFYDDDQPEAAGYVRVAGEVRPALLIIDSAGRTVWSGKLPESIEGVKAAVVAAGR